MKETIGVAEHSKEQEARLTSQQAHPFLVVFRP